MIVVDTNVWSEATKRAPSVAVREWTRRHSDRLWLSVIVVAELRGGSAQLPPGRRRQGLEEQFDALERDHADRLLRFDQHTARCYAQVLESARRRGKPIATADAMIAATAIQHGMAVATRDLGDFAGAEVDLLDPWVG